MGCRTRFIFKDENSMPCNVPTLLTWLRIILIPLFVGVFYLPDTVLSVAHKNGAATLIFVLAAATDGFDGFLARRLNQISAFGAFLDPVADKLMVTAALLMLVQLKRLDAAIALIIVGREITIVALREWMALLGASRHIAVNSLGKIKTACQMTAIPLLLFDGALTFGAYAPRPLQNFVMETRDWGLGLIGLAAVLTIGSMLYYMKLAWPKIRRYSGVAFHS
jgi:cardiolipin synthase (CMP-forming)